MKHALQAFSVSVMALCLGACGSDAPVEPGEQVLSVSYRATNQTAADLIVGLSGPAVAGATAVEVAVTAGETVVLLAYDSTSPAVPAVEDDFWCVSVLQGVERTLVQQLCPVAGDQWERDVAPGSRADFRLIITDDDLEPIEDLCPRLAGVVFESETGQAIVGATIAYHGAGEFFLTTNASGRYLFYLPAGPLQGVLEVGGEGYRSVMHTLPGDITGNSSGLYRLDFGLMSAGG